MPGFHCSAVLDNFTCGCSLQRGRARVHCGTKGQLRADTIAEPYGVSTEPQNLTVQRHGLRALGVGDDRIYVDHGLTGTHRDRPGLRLALAACRAGDTLVVTKLDRLARSLPDARDILDELTRRNVKLSLGSSIHKPD